MADRSADAAPARTANGGARAAHLPWEGSQAKCRPWRDDLEVSQAERLAALAEKRWLEATFDRLDRSLHRIETRLRDDDFGRLEAADALASAVADEGIVHVPEQFRLELAVVRHDVERIYCSRRRFVEQFKAVLEEHQTKHEGRTENAGHGQET